MSRRPLPERVSEHSEGPCHGSSPRFEDGHLQSLGDSRANPGAASRGWTGSLAFTPSPRVLPAGTLVNLPPRAMLFQGVICGVMRKRVGRRCKSKTR